LHQQHHRFSDAHRAVRISVSAFGAVLGLTDAVAQIACTQTLVALGAEFVATPLTIWLRGPESMPGASIRWRYDMIIIIRTA
jgi:hypothetical protein